MNIKPFLFLFILLGSFYLVSADQQIIQEQATIKVISLNGSQYNLSIDFPFDKFSWILNSSSNLDTTVSFNIIRDLSCNQTQNSQLTNQCISFFQENPSANLTSCLDSKRIVQDFKIQCELDLRNNVTILKDLQTRYDNLSVNVTMEIDAKDTEIRNLKTTTDNNLDALDKELATVKGQRMWAFLLPTIIFGVILIWQKKKKKSPEESESGERQFRG